MRRPIAIVALALGVIAATGALGWYLGHRARTVGPKLKDFHVQSFEHVPAVAVGAFSFDVGWMMKRLLDDNLDLFTVKADVGALRKALTEQSQKHLGIDLLAARRATAWFEPETEAFAVWIEGPFDGKLVETDRYKDRPLGTLGGEVFATLDGDGLVIGNRRGVQLAIDVSTGDQKSLAKDEKAVAARKKALDEVADGSFVASASLATLPAVELEAGALSMGIDASLVAAVTGPKATLEQLKSGYDMASGMAAAGVQRAFDKAEKKKQGELMLLTTLAKYKIDDVFNTLVVELDGDALTLRSEGSGAVIAMYAGAFSWLFMARSVSEPVYAPRPVQEF